MNLPILFQQLLYFKAMDQHPEAHLIVKTLTQAGFVAYYAGGWVRDHLLNHPSDDIDIATNAPPEAVQSLFPRTVPIGLSFGIILVVMEHHQYEVATFRQDFDYIDGRRPSKVHFSTAEEDAKRRDFTINGMFYDPMHEKLLDYVGGQKDLAARIIRAIGDPHERIKEDRLRMIRAIRLSCRFQFAIESLTEKAIYAHASEIFPAVAIERIVQELTKGLKTNHLACMLIKLHQFHLLSAIFPSLAHTSLGEIQKRLTPLADYPKQAPLIAYLLPLFPDLPLIDQIALCQKLKLPNTDQQFASFLFGFLEQLRSPSEDLFAWANLHANPFGKIALHIAAAHLPKEQQESFHRKQNNLLQKLHRSIERIKNKTPVVTSSHLLAAGILPSKAMGTLLFEAEKISVNEQIEDPDQLLEKLKTLPIWPRANR